MNPLKLSCHHGFFKSRIAFGQRRGQGHHALHVHTLSGKQHDFMAQACGFEAVVRYQHTRHALPLDFFHQHGDQNIAQIAVQTDERLVQQGKVAAAQLQAQKCYPFRHAAGQFGRIFVQIARSQPDFRRQRDDFAFIGFVHKNSDILHRSQVFRQAVFLKLKTRYDFRRPFYRFVYILLLKLFQFFFTKADLTFIFTLEWPPNSIFPKNGIAVIIPLGTDLFGRQKFSSTDWFS